MISVEITYGMRLSRGIQWTTMNFPHLDIPFLFDGDQMVHFLEETAIRLDIPNRFWRGIDLNFEVSKI
jgi:hypothetical protein